MQIRIYRNNIPGAPRFRIARLPISQTMLWIGPFFLLVQRRDSK